MTRKWVVNASPLILLGRVDQLSLMPQLATELAVPSAVHREILLGPPEDPAAQWLQGPGKSLVKPVPSIPASILSWVLGFGESEVIASARHNPGRASWTS